MMRISEVKKVKIRCRDCENYFFLVNSIVIDLNGEAVTNTIKSCPFIRAIMDRVTIEELKEIVDKCEDFIQTDKLNVCGFHGAKLFKTLCHFFGISGVTFENVGLLRWLNENFHKYSMRQIDSEDTIEFQFSEDYKIYNYVRGFLLEG